MNDYITELTLDLNCTPKIQLIALGQYDKGRKFSITVTANGKEFDISNCSAVLKGVRSDKSHFAVDCDIVDNKIIVNTEDTTFNVRGKAVARIVLIDSLRSYSTQSFVIDVCSAYEGNVSDQEEVSILNNLIQRVYELAEIEVNFANDISECVDTDKLYVLPDGYIYAYLFYKKDIAYTNLADISSTDWLTGYRINSSKQIVKVENAPDLKMTNYFDVSGKSVLHIKGLNVIDALVGTQNYNRVIFYDENREIINVFQLTSYSERGFYLTANYDSAVTLLDLNAVYDYFLSVSLKEKTKYIRLGGVKTVTDDTDIVITSDENIEKTTVESYDWKNTGHAFARADYEDRFITAESAINSLQKEVNSLKTEEIPDYWLEHLDSRINDIKALQDKGGKDCFSFVVLADMHWGSNLGKKSPQLIKYIMDKCGIKKCLILGDTQSRGAWSTKEKAESEFDETAEALSIINGKLRTQGNHDGSWGTLNGESYVYNFTPNEIFNRIYRNVYAENTNAKTDISGTAYYIDDEIDKVRYIMLNTHCNAYVENEDKTIKYNNMKIFRFGQSQYDFLCNVALATVPEGYSVIIGAHAPISNLYADLFGGSDGEAKTMRGVLTAYGNKTTYSREWAGTSDYDKVKVNADFTQAKGEFVGYFSGHTHADYIHPKSDWGINIITHRCDAKEENDSTVSAERVEGTTTEHSFDVVTVNTATKAVYITKIGAGEDRAVTY